MLRKASPPVVEVRSLIKRYGTVTAVDDVSFSIGSGSVTALLGGNGAGKTTTIAMLLGLVVPTSGDIRVFGVDMAHGRHSVLHRMNFESPYVNMPMRLTVRQNLRTFGQLYGVRQVDGRIARLTGELRLEEFIDRPVGQLSSGQKTRAALAKALINSPELLLLDEPTASLDPDTADWVRERLRSFQRERGATILMASHNMTEVERMAERVIMLDRGRIVEDGPPKALLASYGRTNLEDVFLDIARNRGQRGMAGQPEETREMEERKNA